MSDGRKIPLSKALRWAERIVEILSPHCDRIEIAGSIRRQKPEIGDIEVVCIPKRNTDLLGGKAEVVSGFADTVNQWEKVRGEPTGKYTQRILPNTGGFKVDIFITDADSWGWQLALRTGSADFNQKYLQELKKRNMDSAEGKIYNYSEILKPRFIPVSEEKDFFALIGMEYVEPIDRT